MCHPLKVEKVTLYDRKLNIQCFFVQLVRNYFFYLSLREITTGIDFAL